MARYDGFIAAAARTSVKSGGNDWEWTSQVRYRSDHVNPAAAPQAFAFAFDIFAMSMRIFDREGMTRSAEIFAQVRVNRSDGTSTALFRIDETLTGGVFSRQLVDGGTDVPASTFTCDLMVGGVVHAVTPAVPEPAPWLLGVAGGALLRLRRRR